MAWIAMSMPIHCRSKACAATIVVAQPQNGSSTTSPGLLLALMMRSKSFTGFWVRKPILSL